MHAFQALLLHMLHGRQGTTKCFKQISLSICSKILCAIISGDAPNNTPTFLKENIRLRPCAKDQGIDFKFMIAWDNDTTWRCFYEFQKILINN